MTADQSATAGPLVLPAPLIGFMGASECIRRSIHYQRARNRYRRTHPIIEVVEGRHGGRELTADELRK